MGGFFSLLVSYRNIIDRRQNFTVNSIKCAQILFIGKSFFEFERSFKKTDCAFYEFYSIIPNLICSFLKHHKNHI